MGYLKWKGGDSVENKLVKISDLRQVKGIGAKTIERIKEYFDKSEYISEYNPDIHVEPNSLVNGDMLEVMNGIPDESIDMILTDLPYGTTQNKWDSVIDLSKVWKQYNRVIKNDGAIVLFSQTPFDKVLGGSNIDNLKYEWIWRKNKPTGHLNAKKMPMKNHENILVFYKEKPTYNCFDLVEVDNVVSRTNKGNYGESSKTTRQTHTGYPRSVINFENVPSSKQVHQTQKPVDLLEYLVKTYTNKNEVVLDSTMGSGSTGVACKNTNRRFIGIELDREYFKIAKRRIEEVR